MSAALAAGFQPLTTRKSKATFLNSISIVEVELIEFHTYLLGRGTALRLLTPLCKAQVLTTTLGSGKDKDY